MIIDLKKYFQGAQTGAGPEDTVEYDLDLSGLELGGVRPFLAPVKVTAGLRGFAESALLTVRAAYTVTMPCDRCCETVSRGYEKHFSHTLVRELGDDQDDDAFVAVPDEKLDLDELLREDILLDMPSKFLCSPECRGICPRCGKNLNEGPCGCGSHEIDPRLQVLKSML